MAKLKLSSRVMRVGARSTLLAGVLGAYVIAACATGGDGETLEGGSGSPDSPIVTDGPGHPHDTNSGDPDSFQSPDTFVPAKDSAPPPVDTSMMDTFIPPTDSTPPPVDGGMMDSPPPPKDVSMDVPVVTPTCNPFGIKYAAEYSALGESAVPCSDGCTATQCCWHLASPPACLTK